MSLRSFFRRGPVASAIAARRSGLGEPLQNHDREGDRVPNVRRQVGPGGQEAAQPFGVSGVKPGGTHASPPAAPLLVRSDHDPSVDEAPAAAQSEREGGSE